VKAGLLAQLVRAGGMGGMGGMGGKRGGKRGDTRCGRADSRIGFLTVGYLSTQARQALYSGVSVNSRKF